MKKLMLILMLMIVLTASFAEAAELSEAASGTEVFTFRNGIHWGDSVEDVFRAEGEGRQVWNNDRVRCFGYEKVPVSDYTAFVQYYYFIDDQLVCTYYAFVGLDEKDTNYLSEALIFKYGEPVDNDEERLHALLEPIDLDGEFDLHYNWRTKDNTCIAAFSDPECFVIIYCDETYPDLFFPEYNTNGL